MMFQRACPILASLRAVRATCYCVAVLLLSTVTAWPQSAGVRTVAVPETGSLGLHQRTIVVNRSEGEVTIPVRALDSKGRQVAENEVDIAGHSARSFTLRAVFGEEPPTGTAYVEWGVPAEAALYIGRNDRSGVDAVELQCALTAGRMTRLAVSPRAHLLLINGSNSPNSVTVVTRRADGTVIDFFQWALGVGEFVHHDLAFEESTQAVEYESSAPVFAALLDGEESPTLIPAMTLESGKAEREAPCSKPSIVSYRINYGASSTNSRDVRLNNSASSSPKEYRASQTRTFSGASWHSYNNDPVFHLSSGDGTKTVYLQLRNSCGTSAARSDSIQLIEPIGDFTISAFGGCSITQPIIEVSWAVPSGSPTSYDIFRNGALVVRDLRPNPANTTFMRWRDSVAPGQKFTYMVRAKKGSLTKDSRPRESSPAPLYCQ
jgi:hypothetical protein